MYRPNKSDVREKVEGFYKTFCFFQIVSDDSYM